MGLFRSALKKLFSSPFDNFELIKIPNENKREIKIDVHSVGLLKGNKHALGISFAKSGLHLDITNNLRNMDNSFFRKSTNSLTHKKQINIIAGHGVGIYENTSEICISNFAKKFYLKIY